MSKRKNQAKSRRFKARRNTFDGLLDRARRRAKVWEAASKVDCITTAPGYAEPGYDDPPSGIVAFGDWNTITRYDEATRTFIVLDDTPGWLAKKLEEIGVALEWEDEWATCEHCGKAVRTQADSYGWQKSYWEPSCGGCECMDCLDPAEVLEELEGKEKNCLTISSIDPADHGYIRLEDRFEHGWHRGQDASPKLIAKALKDQGINRFLFTLDSTGQFDINFSVWVHQDEHGKLDEGKWNQAQKDGPSVSAALERSLKAAGSAPEPPGEGGVVVTKINTTTGEVRKKRVSTEDFVAGKALED
jgi:hypothetical protein